MMLHNVLMGLLVCHFAMVVVCRQTLSPTILFKSTNAQHATVSKSRQLLRSITPNLVIRGGNSGDKKDTEDTGISWDSHMNVNNIPATLLNKLDGSHTMRAKFEKLCRESQVITYFLIYENLVLS